MNDRKQPLPESPGWYFVTFHQFNKQDETDPDYFNEWVEFDGVDWEYKDYEERSIITKIIKREEV